MFIDMKFYGSPDKGVISMTGVEVGKKLVKEGRWSPGQCGSVG